MGDGQLAKRQERSMLMESVCSFVFSTTDSLTNTYGTTLCNPLLLCTMPHMFLHGTEAGIRASLQYQRRALHGNRLDAERCAQETPNSQGNADCMSAKRHHIS